MKYALVSRLKSWILGKVRYLLGGGGGGGGLGLQRGGSSMKFWSNGGGSRVLNLWKSGEGHAFRYRNHKFCKISNAFSAIQGAQISKFPGGACPRIPLASECFHVHVNPISLNKTCFPHSIHHVHFFHCQFLTNLSWFGQDTLGTSWHVSQTFFKEHLVNATAFSFRIEIDRGVLLEKNTNVIFVQRVAGTTFEDSFMTYTKWNSAFCRGVATVCNYTSTAGQKWPVVSRRVKGRRGGSHIFRWSFVKGHAFLLLVQGGGSGL